MFKLIAKGAKFNGESLESDRQLIKEQITNDPSSYVCISTQIIAPDETEEDFKANSAYELQSYDYRFLREFEELPEHMSARIRQLCWKQPTLPQSLAYAPILAFQDVVMICETGSGKTAAYLIPILQALEALPPKSAISALVLCPTRELCEETLRLAGKLSNTVKSQILGTGTPQRTTLAIATPGAAEKSSSIAAVKHLVLDECDALLSSASINAVDTILTKFADKPQISLFSASFDERVRLVCNSFLQNPAMLFPRVLRPTENVSHHWLCCGLREHRLESLKQLLIEVTPPVIIFCVSSDVAREAEAHVGTAANYPCLLLTGEMNQSERMNAFRSFRDKQALALICTDAAARGLDFEGVKSIIQLTAPPDTATYLHRAGRAGRQTKGVCWLFYTSVERKRGVLEPLWKSIDGCEREGYTELAPRELQPGAREKKDEM